MQNQKPILLLLFALAALTLVINGNRVRHVFEKPTFVIVGGSENETLEPIVVAFGKEKGFEVKMKYLGSVDVMMGLQDGNLEADAVWPASTIWISIGDREKRVKNAKSIMTSPVVWGIQPELAKSLGFTGRAVRVRDLLSAVSSGKLRFSMTSATQSNSGAMAYLGFLHALLGKSESLSMADASDPIASEGLKKIFSGVQHSSGSSGWLKDLFLESPSSAMVNYESLLIETNQELVRRGREPLQLVYPVDGIMLADSPLGLLAREPDKTKFFDELQDYLLSDKIQKELLSKGRRTGFGGSLDGADPAVFNPAWGIDTKRVLSSVPLPAPDVVMEALNRYQGELRKPSFTVFCLDYSGSMQGPGIASSRKAMQLILDQNQARRHLLQITHKDKISILPFSNVVFPEVTVDAAEPASLGRALERVQRLEPDGGTAIHSCVIKALEKIRAEPARADFVPAVILMTDGQSNDGATFTDLKREVEKNGNEVPVFSIMFGEAKEEQLKEISALTRGRLFDGRTNLVNAFRNAKGYN